MRASELELQVELHAARRLSGYGPYEKRRRNCYDIGNVVRVVERGERVQGDGNDLGFVLMFREGEVVGKVEVQTDQAGTRHGVAGNAGGAVVDDAVVIVVGASRDRDGLARVKGKTDPEREEAGGLAGGKQVELVKTVIVGTSPVGGRIVAVAGKEGDPAGVVVGAAERVLNLPHEILAGLAAEGEFHRVSLEVSLRLNLADLAEGWVGAHVVSLYQHRRHGINRTEIIDAALSDLDRACLTPGNGLP